MKRTRHTPEQVIRKLRDAERMLAEGKDLTEVTRALEISVQTYHRWQTRYGGLKGNDAKRLRELEAENVRLKRLVAELLLDNQMLKEAARGNF